MPRRGSGDLTKIFGERVLKRREELGLEKRELGRMIGVEHTTIWKYEEGLQGPQFETLPMLADALKCTIDYLLGRSDFPDHILVNGEQLPKELRDKNIDAIDVLRTQVTEDGGITLGALREILLIVSQAKLLTHSRPRHPKTDLLNQSEN